MVNKAKILGTKGETARVNYMKGRGWTYARRITQGGAKDLGDLILDQAVPVMIESKETKGFTPSEFLKETLIQIENAGAEFGFCIIKKRGTTDVGQYYSLTSVEQQMKLIEMVYKKPQAEPRRVIRRRRSSTG